MDYMEELLDYCDRQDKVQLASKALRIANKCSLAGKTELAYKIYQKYQKHFPKSDLTVAFGFAIMAARSKPEYLK